MNAEIFKKHPQNDLQILPKSIQNETLVPPWDPSWSIKISDLKKDAFFARN